MLSLEEIQNDWSRTTVTDNVIRWKSNGKVPFSDVLTSFYNEGYITPFQMYNSESVRQEEVDAFLEDYRKQMETYVPDAEELFEMRAAFGEGASVMNVITGKRIQL